MTNWIVRYVAVFLIASTNAAVLPFLAHRTATVSGSTATALATGGIIALANCGGISAPFLFPSATGPRYQMGNVSAALLYHIEGRTNFHVVDCLCDARSFSHQHYLPRMETRDRFRVQRCQGHGWRGD